MFNLAIDSELRGCDLVKLTVGDVANGRRIVFRAMIFQQKIQRPVQFEITDQTRVFVADWIEKARLHSGDYFFPSRVSESPHLTTRQYS